MTDAQSIAQRIIAFVLKNYPCQFDTVTLPRDESLLELGIIDSYGVIDLVTFLEDTWNIAIADEELTKEKMGSINRMAHLVNFKLTDHA